jgi:3-methyl-2-oxobutanoate hydroxymethyltransferase
MRAARSISIHHLRGFKERGEHFAMLTAYDFPTAQILDEAGVPVLLVGDSLGDNVLGYRSTVPVTVDEMVHHTAAVSRGAERALVVADLPFMSYQVSVADGMRNAGRLVKEGGAGAVKLEGGTAVVDLVGRLVTAGIPVMGHLGLTPQSVHQLGGHKVQGRSEEDAARILADAKALEEAGAFALVLECVPAELGRRVTEELTIPVIGIGAGSGTDAQVMVTHDLVGIGNGPRPRFVKAYADVRVTMTDAVKAFQAEIVSGDYPGPEHQY